MTQPNFPPPQIFAPARREARRLRLVALQKRPDAPRYILDEMIGDIEDTLDFLRFAPATALVIGDWTGTLALRLGARGIAVTSVDPAGLGGLQRIDEEQPLGLGQFDLIASLGTLDTLNDLPGALIHLRHALAKGGLMLASFMGAGSLPVLREIMLAADADRPAARLHPMVDVRAGGQLLQRTGFARPVVNTQKIPVSFRSLAGLLADLRAQGLGNVLAQYGPPLGKAAMARAHAAFAAQAETQDGRVTEIFEILTLSGWRE